jgi:hypothetical protein
MNRHERRAAAARCIFPPAYLRTCDAMADELRAWLKAHPGERPRFALTSPQLYAIASLDQVADLVTRDDAARELVERFNVLGVEIGGEGHQPTMAMLRAVLDVVRVSYEMIDPHELGRFTVCRQPSGPSGPAN